MLKQEAVVFFQAGFTELRCSLFPEIKQFLSCRSKNTHRVRIAFPFNYSVGTKNLTWLTAADTLQERITLWE